MSRTDLQIHLTHTGYHASMNSGGYHIGATQPGQRAYLPGYITVLWCCLPGVNKHG